MYTSVDPSTSASNSTSLARYRAEGAITIPSRKLYFSGPHQPQQWPFPNSIIYYITTTPSSSKGYQKMLQSCKYFFSKHPIIVISELSYYVQWAAELNHKNVYPFKWDKKVWLTDYLLVYPQQQFNPSITSSIVSNFYRCDIRQLILTDQIITFQQFLLLASNAKQIALTNVIVKYQDNIVAAIEELVEALPNAKDIKFDTRANISSAAMKAPYNASLAISSRTMAELLKIEHFSKIDAFGLYDLAGTFDIETFYNYMKENKHTKFTLIFNGSISEAYKIRLEAIVDEIIADEVHDYRLPLINFPELAAEKRAKIPQAVCYFSTHHEYSSYYENSDIFNSVIKKKSNETMTR